MSQDSFDLTNEKFEIDNILNALYKVYEGTNYTDPINIGELTVNRFKTKSYGLDQLFTETPIHVYGLFPTGYVINDVPVKQLMIRRTGKIHPSIIRIVPYQDKRSADHMDNPIFVNQIMRTLLSEFVCMHRTKNLTLSAINIDVDGSVLAKYDSIKKYIDKTLYYSVQVTEKYYKFTTLSKFMKDYPLPLEVLTSILHQIIDVLLIIYRAYPGFIMGYLLPDTIDCYLEGNDVIYPEIKLSNFYLSKIDDFIDNNYYKQSQNKPNVKNSYFDIYQFLNFMWNNYHSDISAHKQLVSFFDDILPTEIRSPNNFLTLDVWNKISDEKKDELTLRKIKSHRLFSVNEDKSIPKYISTNEIDVLSGGIELVSLDNIPQSPISSDSIEKSPVKKSRSKNSHNKKSNKSNISNMVKNSIPDKNSYKKVKNNKTHSDKKNTYEDNYDMSRLNTTRKPQKYRGQRKINLYSPSPLSKKSDDSEHVDQQVIDMMTRLNLRDHLNTGNRAQKYSENMPEYNKQHYSQPKQNRLSQVLGNPNEVVSRNIPRSDTSYFNNMNSQNMNPNVNPNINPHINPNINPNINPSMSPSMNPNINPNMYQNMNPNVNPNMMGMNSNMMRMNPNMTGNSIPDTNGMNEYMAAYNNTQKSNTADQDEPFFFQ